MAAGVVPSSLPQPTPARPPLSSLHPVLASGHDVVLLESSLGSMGTPCSPPVCVALLAQALVRPQVLIPGPLGSLRAAALTWVS